MFRDGSRSGERWVLQTRRTTHVVPLETVHALAGQMLDVQGARGILVTTGWFGASSRACRGGWGPRSGSADSRRAWLEITHPQFQGWLITSPSVFSPSPSSATSPWADMEMVKTLPGRPTIHGP